MLLGRILIVFGLLTMTAACSTTTDRYSGANASPEAALKNYTRLGADYLRAGDTVSAKAPLQRALSIDSGYAPAYNVLALVFQTEKDNTLAEEYFKKALSADSSSAMIHNNYGAFLFSQERYTEACHELSRATEDPFYPQRAQAFENLGKCYRHINRDDVAEHAFRRALMISGQRPVAMVELAELLLDEGKPAQAVKLYEQFRAMVASKQIDHSARSLWVGIRIARQQGDSARAATYALLLKNMFPNSSEYKLYKESEQ